MYAFSLSRGPFSIDVGAEALGGDICVTVTGGVPHIGAVAMSVARPSLRGDETVGASTSILAMTGHKDDSAAKYISEHLAKNLNKNVVSVCGIHYDNIDQDGIDTILTLVKEASQRLREHFAGAGKEFGDGH
jgi:NADPH-dependent curcumin reductase CurA